MEGDFRFMYAASNYQSTVAFWRDTVGLEVVEAWDDPDGKGTIFGAASGQVEVLEATDYHPFVAPQGVGLAFEVDDIDGWHERLAGAGADVTQAPTDQPWGHRNVVIREPDGIEVTLFTVIG